MSFKIYVYLNKINVNQKMYIKSFGKSPDSEVINQIYAMDRGFKINFFPVQVAVATMILKIFYQVRNSE